MSNIKDAAGAVEGIAKAVPVYQDLLQPAMKELGNGVHTLSKTIHIALAPVSALIWGYDQIKDYVQTSLESRLARIPKENIIPPDLTIAGSTLEALRYTGHKEELREMFSNLLATAMDSITAPKAHPSFVELLKQINVDEAKIIKYLSTHKSNPQITIEVLDKGTIDKFAEFHKHFSLIPYTVGCNYPKLGHLYFGNLERLGLVRFRNDRVIDSELLYEEIIHHKSILDVTDKMKEIGFEFKIKKGVIENTGYGIEFSRSCVISK